MHKASFPPQKSQQATSASYVLWKAGSPVFTWFLLWELCEMVIILHACNANWCEYVDKLDGTLW